MKDREHLDREYLRARNLRAIRRGFIVTVIAIFFGLIAYLAYDIPARTQQGYDILVSDLEWRRARLEKPYREIEMIIEGRAGEGSGAEPAGMPTAPGNEDDGDVGAP